MTKKKDSLADPPKLGRPSGYSQELGEQICSRIIEGKSLRKVCAMDDMPAASSVFKWLNENDSFSEQYTRACAERRELNKERLLDIPTDQSIDPTRGRLLCDNIKWVLSKEEPKKYGNIVTNDTTLTIKQEQTVDELEAELKEASKFPAVKAFLDSVK